MSRNPSNTSNRKPLYYIFRPWRRHPKTGEKLWARHYGLRAWCIPVYR